MLPSIGPLELIVVLAIALIVLGPKRLPDAGRSLGQGIRGFRRSLSGDDEAPELEAPRETPTRADSAAQGR
jgi:sec-independent protein translocase protein TatA